MRIPRRLSNVALAASLGSAGLWAEVKLPAIFGSHMVLQRDEPIVVWGQADPGEAVTVTLGDQSAQATAGPGGDWRVSLPAAAVARDLTLTVAAKNTLTFADVAVGEVWLCSGQSNMEMGVTMCLDVEKELAAGEHPDLRLIDVPTFGTQAQFQQPVSGLQVRSNVPGVAAGDDLAGFIEFWPCNYGPPNAAKVPGAADGVYDMGDQISPDVPDGYGSMQVHNLAARQVILACNNWKSREAGDLGIGNAPGPQPDWTFSKSAGSWATARLQVLVRLANLRTAAQRPREWRVDGLSNAPEMPSEALSRRGFLRVAAGAAGLSVALAKAADLPTLLPPVWQPTSDRKIRLAVVGGRFGLSFHWHEHPNCSVVAVSDLIPERCQALQQRYQCATSYPALEKLLLDPKVEAVALFTGAPDHARHMLLCLDHGKHVISAVPACLTLEEAVAMKAKKEQTGLTYMMAETSFYRPHCLLARRLFRDGALGEMVYCEAEYYHPMLKGSGERHALHFHNGQRTWRYGLPPMLYPTHSTAFLVGVTGERLMKVSCVGHRAVDDDVYGEQANVYGNPFDAGMALFLTDAGHPFRCNVSWNIHAHGERAQWFGTAGALYSDGSGGQPTTIAAVGKTVHTLPDFSAALPPALRLDSGHGGSHPFITHEFIMALIESRAPAIDLYEALAYTVPGIVAHQSSFKDGEQLPIPSFDPA